MRGGSSSDDRFTGKSGIEGWLSTDSRKTGDKGKTASHPCAALCHATSTWEGNQTSVPKPNSARNGSLTTSDLAPAVNVTSTSASPSKPASPVPGGQSRISQASVPLSTADGHVKRRSSSGGNLYKFFKPVDGERNRVNLLSVDVERRTRISPSLSAKSSAGPDRSDSSKKLRQSCLSFSQHSQTVKRDTNGMTFGEALSGFTFERHVRVLDDLDDVILAGAASLPDLPLLEDDQAGWSLSMKMLAELAVIHDFVRVFSGELFDFSLTDSAGKHLSLEYLEKAVMDHNGFSRKIAELHAALLNYIYLDHGKEAFIDDALDFQQFTAEVLGDCEESIVLRTVEYPNISPETRVAVLSMLVALVIESDSFALHLKQLDSRQAELRKERLKRRELRQVVESAIAELGERCASLERRIGETEMTVEQQAVQLMDAENQANGMDCCASARTSRQLGLECRRATEKQKKALMQESRALVAKQQNIKELDAKDDRFDADREKLASLLRGGDVVPSKIACSGVVKLGFDRWGRTYWHWKSVGGILVEEAQELPERRRPARGADEMGKAHLPPTISLDTLPHGGQREERPGGEAPISTADEVTPPAVLWPQSPPTKVGLPQQSPKLRSRAKWWCIHDVELFREVFRNLNMRGPREKALKTNLATIRQDIENSYPMFEKWLRRRGALSMSSAKVQHPQPVAAVVLSNSNVAEEHDATKPAVSLEMEAKEDEGSAKTNSDRMSIEEYLAQQATRVLSMATMLRDIAEERNATDFENLYGQSAADSNSPSPPFDPLLPPPLEVLTSELPRLVAEYVRDLVAAIAAGHTGTSRGDDGGNNAENKPSRKNTKLPPAAIVAKWAAKSGYFGIQRTERSTGESSQMSSFVASTPALGITAAWLGELLRDLENGLDSKVLRRVQRREREARRERMRAIRVLENGHLARRTKGQNTGKVASEGDDAGAGEDSVEHSRVPGSRDDLGHKRRFDDEAGTSDAESPTERDGEWNESLYAEEWSDEDESEVYDGTSDISNSEEFDDVKICPRRSARSAPQDLRRSRRVAAMFVAEKAEDGGERHKEDEDDPPRKRRPKRAAAVVCEERTRLFAAELARSTMSIR